MNKALILFAHGKGFALVAQADEPIENYIGVGCLEGFDLDEAGTDYINPGDGLWIGDLSLVDDGPSDWERPDLRECVLRVSNLRAATAEEWASHRRDEWPWPQAEESGAKPAGSPSASRHCDLHTDCDAADNAMFIGLGCYATHRGPGAVNSPDIAR